MKPFTFTQNSSATQSKNPFTSQADPSKKTNLFALGTKVEPCKPPTVPDAIKDKQISDILASLEAQLEKQTKEFHIRANKIAKLDKIIFDCITYIAFLDDQVRKTSDKQNLLRDEAIQFIQEQEKVIEKMQNDASPTSNFAEVEVQREKLYRMARDLGKEYVDLETKLKEIFDDIQKKSFMDDSLSDLDKITRISNCHLNSLQWMNFLCNNIEERLDNLTKSLNGCKP